MKQLLHAIAILSGICIQVIAAPTDWYEPIVENRPFVRWWWHGSAVDTTGLTYNLEEFANHGIGGVEITPIYGVRGNEANDIPYLSDRWMEMLGHTISEGNRLGLQIDMNNGTGWPFGGPQVTAATSARKHIVCRWPVYAGETTCIRIVPSDRRQSGVAAIDKVIAVHRDRRLDITSFVGADTVLRWTPPGEGWEIYALFSGRTFQKVKRAAPGGEGLVVNHYDSVAVKEYLQRFDNAFARFHGLMPNTFFNDSYEVYGSDWTESITDEFFQEHGYRLEHYLPEFANDSLHTELRARVVSDYRRTLGNMLYENFTRVWTNWAHEHGARIRNQSHGSPANIIDLYAAVDIPECESFGQTRFDIPGLCQDGPSRPSDADPAVLKFASSAAHLAGKPFTSAETLTWLTEHFRTSLSRCKPEIDQMFCSGVNHVYFHGAPYSPKGARFPGWLFYAAINMSPTAALWNDAPQLFSYITRCQAFLTAGIPDSDFLLFFPFDDILHRQDGNPYLMFDIHKMDRRMPDVKAAVAEILRNGYDVDYLSDSLTSVLETNPDGALISRGGNAYRAVIVPGVKFMQPATLGRLLQLAREGATLCFAGGYPSDVPGLGHLDERRPILASLLSQLPAWDSVPAVHLFGKGKIITSPAIGDALSLTGVDAEPLRKDGVSMIRRRNEVGGFNYFISLLSDRAIDGWVTLAVENQEVEIFDPVTGKYGMAMSRSLPGGLTSVRLQVVPGQSFLLKTFPVSSVCHGRIPEWTYYAKAHAPVDLARGWRISFPESEPPIEETFCSDSLIPWTSLPEPRATVNSGTGRYSITFDLPKDIKADEWELDLGDVRESARVYVNGSYAGTAWCVPFILRIGEWLRPGMNRLDIDVTNLEANRMADYERRGVKWRIFKDANIASVTNAKKFSFGDWETVPSGLNSKVTLHPLVRN